MRRSKLEIHGDILKVLAQRGPLKKTHIMYKTNVSCSVLDGYLAFMIKQGVVEMRIIKRARKIYAITQRGISVLKQFRELEIELPIVEETRETKYPLLLKHVPR